MNEIMVHESFSFPEDSFTHVDISNDCEGKDSANESDFKDSDCNESMDTSSGKELDDMDEESLDINIHKFPNSSTVLCNNNTVAVDKIIESNSSPQYGIVAYNVKNMMTKTTVIKRKYNLISQSTLTDIRKEGFISNCTPKSSPSFMKSDTLDKSRVVVQVLTSDSKKTVETQAVENTNNSYGYPSMYSFRDDVLKILSRAKTQPSQIEDDSCSEKRDIQVEEANTIESAKETGSKYEGSKRKYQNCCSEKRDIQVEEANTIESAKETGSKYEGSKRIVKLSSKRKFFAKNGKGIKFEEIKYVASNLRNASPSLLRILHYILFDSYGPCNTGMQIINTRRKILNFYGYPFERNSEIFEKKKKCLLKLPYPILTEMHERLIRCGGRNRYEMVSELMDFFLKPGDIETNSDNDEDGSEKSYTIEELKKLALRDLPSVAVKRLSKNDIKKIKNEIKLQSSFESDPNNSCLPAYILKGPGQKLKSFSQIADNLHAARRGVIKKLHYILYGRVESTEVCRRNILEFSGFLRCQKEFAKERENILDRMDHVELYQLCQIFCLHAKTNSRARKIKKIMRFLRKPALLRYRCLVKKKDKEELKYSKPNIANFERQKDEEESNFSRPKYMKQKIAGSQVKVNSGSGPKLRDFKNICSNIECAAPCDLTELNDLLFVKPCDESEIHQRILDFTRFEFLINSIDYHFRKTLMHYMSFCIIRKIAQLLDVKDWDKIVNQDDLADNILNFLMEMNLPDSCNRRLPNFKPPPEEVALSSEKSPEKNVLQVYNREVEENQRFYKSLDVSQNGGFSLDHSYSTEEKNSDIESKNKPVIQCRTKVLIHRLTKAPVQTENNPERRNGSISYTDYCDEDSTPLRAYLHHPSDEELRVLIRNIIETNLWSFTVKDLIQKIDCCFPTINLKYREDFIKTEARQVLSDMRSNAVDTLKNLQFKKMDYLL